MLRQFLLVETSENTKKKIKQKIKDKNTTFIDILKDHLCFRAYRQNDDTISEYFASNIKEIMKYASNSESPYFIYAFRLVAFPTKLVTSALLSHHLINEIAHKVFTLSISKNDLDQTISRLAQIAQGMLFNLTSPAQYLDFSGFCVNFVNHTHLYSVKALFSRMFSEDESLVSFQQHLIEINYIEMILYNYGQLTFKKHDINPYIDKDVACGVSLLSVLALGLKNPIFEKEFLSDRVLKILFVPEEYLLKEQLLTLCYVIDKIEKEKVIEYEKKYRNYLMKDYQKPFPYVENVIRLYSKLVSLYPDDYCTDEIINRILYFIDAFPSNSFILNAVKVYIQNTVFHKDFAEKICFIILPKLFRYVKAEQSNLTLVAFSYSVMNVIFNSSEENPEYVSFLSKIEGYGDFLIDYYFPHNELCKIDEEVVLDEAPIEKKIE